MLSTTDLSLSQVEENKLMGKFPGAKIRIESDFHFPAMGESAPAPNLDNSGDAESVATEEEADGADPGAAVSFARMLRKPSTSKAPAAQPTEPQMKVILTQC